MSFVHRSIRMAVLSAPSQKARHMAFAFCDISAVLSVAFQLMLSGILSASNNTSIFIDDFLITCFSCSFLNNGCKDKFYAGVVFTIDCHNKPAVLSRLYCCTWLW